MTEIIWPENLIEEIAYRRCIIFLGAGVSATATDSIGAHPKTWKELIVTLLEDCKDNLSVNNLSYIENMIEKDNYLFAIQAIFDYSDSGRVSHFLRKEFQHTKFKSSGVHEIIRELDSKIVVTTNFDKLFDDVCCAGISSCAERYYSFFDYRETPAIINNIRSSTNVVIKAHGKIDDCDKLIFSAKQYHKAQIDYSEFYQLLSALFLTHTVLFLGYSLQDPDINLLLQSIRPCLGESSPHYLVCKHGTPAPLKKLWEEMYNIHLIEYGDTYDLLPNALELLKDSVLEMRANRNIG